jgi:subtilisin family serine protease
LWSTIHWLREQGVLVVAAAGNDGLRHQLRANDTPPPPRYPARYQDVFAVAAASAAGTAASYSNRADVRPLGNGITSFGGEVVAPGTPGVAPMTATGAEADGRDKAIVGVYSAERLPDGRPNTTGWVQWAGTSFAAPIVAGLAARMLASDASLEPDQLMQRLRGFAKPMSGAEEASDDPDGPLDAPLLDAWQTYQA